MLAPDWRPSARFHASIIKRFFHYRLFRDEFFFIVQSEAGQSTTAAKCQIALLSAMLANAILSYVSTQICTLDLLWVFAC